MVKATIGKTHPLNVRCYLFFNFVNASCKTLFLIFTFLKVCHIWWSGSLEGGKTIGFIYITTSSGASRRISQRDLDFQSMQEKIRLTEEELEKQESHTNPKDDYIANYNA
jgi:hypothetical protein